MVEFFALKPAGSHNDGVLAWRQLIEAVHACARGLTGNNLVGLGIGQRYRRIGNHRSRGIGDRALNRRVVLPERCRGQQHSYS